MHIIYNEDALEFTTQFQSIILATTNLDAL